MSRRFNTETFIEKSKEIHGDLYDYSKSVYTRIDKTFSFICKKCGYKTTLSEARLHIDKNRGCDICQSRPLRKQNKDIFLRKLKMRTSMFDDYDFSEFKYYGSNKKSIVICNKGHKYKSYPCNMLQKHGCPICAKKITGGSIPNPINEKELEQLLERNIIIKKEDYRYTHSNVESTCLICGHKWIVRYNSLRNGTGCPVCSSSKSEKKVYKFLKTENIKFRIQKSFKKCKYKALLRFDFYIPSKNIIIECHGPQHYKPIKHFNGKEGYIDRKIRDMIKKNYCYQEGIKLLEIPYWEKNIEDILKEELS